MRDIWWLVLKLRFAEGTSSVDWFLNRFAAWETSGDLILKLIFADYFLNLDSLHEIHLMTGYETLFSAGEPFVDWFWNYSMFSCRCSHQVLSTDRRLLSRVRLLRRVQPRKGTSFGVEFNINWSTWSNSLLVYQSGRNEY